MLTPLDVAAAAALSRAPFRPPFQQLLHVAYLGVYIACGSLFSLLVKKSSQDNGGKQPYEPVAGQSREDSCKGHTVSAAHSTVMRVRMLTIADTRTPLSLPPLVTFAVESFKLTTSLVIIFFVKFVSRRMWRSSERGDGRGNMMLMVLSRVRMLFACTATASSPSSRRSKT